MSLIDPARRAFDKAADRAFEIFSHLQTGLAASLVLLTTGADDAAASEKHYVAKHIAFGIDVSGSVDDKERELLMKGLYAALTGDDAQAYYASGICYAMTPVFFTLNTKTLETDIVCTLEEAKISAGKNFWDAETGIVRNPPYIATKGTDLNEALIAIKRVFANEAAQGIVAESHAVILMGDGISVNATNTKRLSGLLSVDYGATVNGIAVVREGAADNQNGDEDVGMYYKNEICTPKNMVSKDLLIVPPGLCVEVSGYEQTLPAFKETLKVVMF